MQLTLNDVQKSFAKVEELINEPNSRLLSWEHCITQFALFCEGLKSKTISAKDITKEKLENNGGNFCCSEILPSLAVALQKRLS